MVEEGLFKKRIDKIMQVECNICHLDFPTIKKFEVHWHNIHEVNYGKSYPKITQYSFVNDACQEILKDAKKEILACKDHASLMEVISKWFGSEKEVNE